ncbi:MAG TPA: phytoene/squalene synthase family protein [Jatrophihabitantaceae bacterium]|nr:phytoene/squalene synthase family protein [Jatrophihabitantaceae bacterium]
MRRALLAAGITSRHLAEGYQLCRRLNATHGKTYYLATLLLPPAKRPYVHALYGFARYADDIVDGFGADRTARFEAWSAEFLADLELGTSAHPVCRAVIDTIGRWDIEHSYFADFLGAMRSDLTTTGYQTHDDLAAYMWGSAAVIGLEMLPILGRADTSIGREVLEPYAADLGIAFQLTNFLRDIAEDLARGRVYLPQESLSAFGVDRDRLRRAVRAGAADEPIRNLLAAEIARTRDLYLRAVPGIELVHVASQDCLRTAVALYSRILDEIEAADYNVFRGRVTVPIARRVGVAAHGLAGALVARHYDQALPM